MPTTHLHALFAPTSVAIVGVSPQRTHGGNVIANLRSIGYTGSVYPVHPTATEFEGLRVAPDLEALDTAPACAVFVLSADKVVGELRKAGRMGVKAAVVFASGFGELNAAGARLEQELSATAKAFGIQLCGPNCMGLADYSTRFSPYSGSLPHQHAPGHVAVLSHSGSGCVVFSNTGRFGVSKLVSLGNSTVLDMPHYLDHLVDDPQTRIAALLVETVRDPVHFQQAAMRMRAAGKHVVVLKNGRSQKGMAATAAHTGALGGAHEAYRQFFEDCGALLVDDMDELIETVTLLERLRTVPRAGRVALIGISGGEIAMACDLAEETRVDLAELGADTKQKIEAAMPKFSFASNPLDTRTFEHGSYVQLMRYLAEDEDVGLLAVAQDSACTLDDRQARRYSGIAHAVRDAVQAIDKPVVFYNNTAMPLHPLLAEPLHQAGVPVLQGARPALLAVSRVMAYGAQAQRPVDPTAEPSAKGQALAPQPHWVERLASGAPFSEAEARQFLQDHGLPVLVGTLATTAQEACEAAERIGRPVVLKIDSPDIAHKTEVGGVELSVSGAQTVAQAFERMRARVLAAAPHARIRGVLVQEMVQGGIEVLGGITRQAPFGPVLTLGWGGTQVELLRDSRVVLAPFTHERIGRQLDSTKVAALLAGFRGAAPKDRETLVDLLVRLTDVFTAYGDLIEALEINPISVLDDGQGVRVLDALLVPQARPNAPNKADSETNPTGVHA